ncbi:MAG: hypothetical protein ABI278_03350 [Candidatus Aquilonibacter sp.]
MSSHVSDLETLCNDLEIGLRERNWEKLDTAISGSRRAMHAFENAMAESSALRDDDFDQAVFARLQRVFGVRDEQMKRLETLHGAAGDRLRALSRWKQYARGVTNSDTGKRPPSLFQDLR